MPLNPQRDGLSQAGLRASHQESPFKAEADGALARFRAYRGDLERQVRRGDLTVKLARQQAEAAAAQLQADLQKTAEDFSPVPRAFLDRLVEASSARRKAKDRVSLEGLQRENNRLLRSTLVEQQLQSRGPEFEAKTFVRPIAGGKPAPTLDSLLAFHQTADHAGDEAAQEWGRRQLEALRPLIHAPEDQRRIDLACDRPDRINPRIVETYVEAMRESDPERLETFVAEALDERDANACMAAFLLARQAPEGTAPRWVRLILNGLNQFPDVALSTLRTLEAEARHADAEAAQAQVEFAARLAQSEARLAGVEPPTDAELDRFSRLQSKPVAQPGESIGLALNRRGLSQEEFDAIWQAETEDV